MKIPLYIFILLLLSACTLKNASVTDNAKADSTAVSAMLDSFHRAAAVADFDVYFSFFADDVVFAGTDATERWDKKTFMAWAKPFFDRKKAWDFRAVTRHIYFSENMETGWFDELLQTQMKLCRASGVVVKENNRWLIKQYILSMTIPNRHTDSVVLLKTAEEDSLLNVLMQ
jgi:hypothetical protein